MKKIANRIAAAMLLLLLLPQTANAAQLLVPGGQVVGLELGDNTVIIAAFDEALGENAQHAGLQVGDEIIGINGTPIRSAEDVRSALTHSDGAVLLSVERDGKNYQFRFTPEITGQGPRLGVYLRQGVTGIGTVTWYDPESGEFGTLGHGVNNAKGSLLQMVRGSAYSARVLSVKKGKAGVPGQLMGTLDAQTPLGSLASNTSQGVFGTLKAPWKGEAVPIGKTEEIHAGPAVIRSTVNGNSVQEYSVEILKIYPKSRENGRNLLIRITDPALLEATGGIVQGMSGSPIIQDGKLIGAVTHVLVNDPTTGYGIFIENMLNAAA